MIGAILLNTPAWVYVLFAVLLWLGLCQLCTRSVSIHRIWLTPIIFIVWGLFGLVHRGGASIENLSPWLITAFVGLLAGLARRNSLTIDRANGRVTRPASVLPLLRNITVFGAHYVLNVAAALNPGQHQFLQADMAVSGLFAGYFAGWLLRFVQHYRATDLSDSTATRIGKIAGESRPS